MKEQDIFELIKFGEHSQLECKLGKGGLPKDIWPTYSAFANTTGGMILLGIEEKEGNFYPVEGIDVVKLQKQFWDHINSNQVSINILQSDDVKPIKVGSYDILQINVPRALRQQKPVSINQNPYIGTYRRNFEGDYKCTKEEVDTMIAESSNSTRDSIVLSNYGLEDLNKQSLIKYRQRFMIQNPNNDWNELDDKEFLRRIGGWGRDREKSIEGLTAAGLLVFGEEHTITDFFNNYFLDYREKVNEVEGQRWMHRFTSQSGDWSGNLYDFYQKVIKRMSEDVDVPFELNSEDYSRVSVTNIQRAIREALLNTIIHADYFTRGNIIVEKNSEEYKFVNPGLLRIPLEKAISGGTSDTRNQNIFKIFSLIGLGERSGYGLENIHNIWRKNDWEIPEIIESFQPETITLSLKTKKLISQNHLDTLKKSLDDEFNALTSMEIKFLSFLLDKNSISRRDIQALLDIDSIELSKMIIHLEKLDIIERNTINYIEFYKLKNIDKTNDEVDRENIINRVKDKLKGKIRVKPEVLKQLVLELCSDNYFTINQISNVLGRTENHIRQKIVLPLVSEGKLELKYPDNPTHSKQAYKTKN